MQNEELYTTQQIAEHYNVSPYTVSQTWVAKGLKCFKGRPLRFRLSWVEDFIEEQTRKHAEQQNICEIVKPKKIKRLPVSSGVMKLNVADFL